MGSQTVRHDWAAEQQQYPLQNNELENKIHPTEGNEKKKIVLNTDRGKGFGDWTHNIYVVKKSQAKILISSNTRLLGAIVMCEANSPSLCSKAL